jgi:zinc transport system permease protein
MVDILIFSLIVGIAVGLSAGYLGSIMVLEKMALVGDALSHVALPGVALGLLFNFDPMLGAFVFLFISTIAIWHLKRATKLSFDTLVGATFTLALAIGILMVPQTELLEALFGDITKVGLFDAIIGIIISIIVIVLTKIIYKKIVLSLISEELAVSNGINVARINLLFLLLVSLTVAIGIKITGTLLVGFLVVTPAAAAKILSSNLSRYCKLSALFGAICATSGILLANYFNLPNLPPGPLVIFTGITIFLVAALIRWRKKIST